MNHLSDRGKRAIDLLTELAGGDLALVRVALTEHGDASIDAVIKYINDHRESPSPPRPTNKLGSPRPLGM